MVGGAGAVKVEEKPRLNGIELELMASGTWIGKRTDEYTARTKEVRVKFTKDGTIDVDTFTSNKNGEDVHRVGLNFRQDGKLNKIKAVITYEENGWGGSVEDLEKNMREFLGHDRVKEWLKERNMAFVEEAKKEAERKKEREELIKTLKEVGPNGLRQALGKKPS